MISFVPHVIEQGNFLQGKSREYLDRLPAFSCRIDAR
jgi:hypothetical protein